ncbi:MAG: hypothetical protein KAR38_00430, partial [Calditrichia bacterium]|nr:hypothetical protein [Calditrichia bacterium]
LPEEKHIFDIWRKTVKNKFSVRQVEKNVKALIKELKELKENKSHKEKIKRKKTPFLQKLEGNLREKFGTKVKIKTKKDGGAIEIDYYSKEDLDRIMEIFDEIKVF